MAQYNGRNATLLSTVMYHLGSLGQGFWGDFHFLAQMFIWTAFVVTAVGMYRVKSWGFFLCVATAMVNRLFSMLIFPSPSGLHPFDAPRFNVLEPGAIANFVIFVPIVLLIRKDLLAPFFNPRLKWWEQHPRMRRSIAINANLLGTMRAYQTFDLSLSGMFLVVPDLHRLNIGDTFWATIELQDIGQQIAVESKIVWISSGEDHPPGFGCSFISIDRCRQKALKTYLQTQKFLERMHVRLVRQSGNLMSGCPDLELTENARPLINKAVESTPLIFIETLEEVQEDQTTRKK